MADLTSSRGAKGNLTSILAQLEELVNENHVLDTKEESIRKKRLENDEKIRRLVDENHVLDTKEESIREKRLENKENIRRLLSRLSNLSRGPGNTAVAVDNENAVVENVNEARGRNNEEDQANIESPGPSDLNRNNAENQPQIEESPVQIVDELRQELRRMKNVLLEEIKTSGNNLRDHHEVLDTLEREHGQGSVPWRNMYKQVKEYTQIHKKFKESRLKSIKDIEERLGESVDQGASFHMESQEASSSTVNNAKEVTARRRPLNESVVDCGKIVKKIPTRELAAMTPTKLKVEEDPPEANFTCNFAYCERTFTCASSLVSHLENHYAQDQVKIGCPFPGCNFSNTKENLTTHMRARHTGEKLFSCQFCPTKFHTMVAKVNHEKKHSQNDVWAQCAKQHCRKFYQVARGNCKSCGKK